MTPNEYKELVDFLGRKFDRIDERFEHVDRRFDQVDQRFEQVDRRFEQVDQRFERLEGEVVGVQGEVRGLQAEVRALRVMEEDNAKQIRKVAEGVTTNGERLDRFQAEVRQEFGDVRQEMKWGFDGIHARVDRVEDAMTQARAARRT